MGGLSDVRLRPTASGGVLIEPEIAPSDPFLGGGFVVTVYNNDYNTYDEVMMILMAATQCDAEEAYMETWEIDHLGKSRVHFADEEECHRVAAIISQIGIQVEVSSE